MSHMLARAWRQRTEVLAVVAPCSRWPMEPPICPSIRPTVKSFAESRPAFFSVATMHAARSLR